MKINKLLVCLTLLSIGCMMYSIDGSWVGTINGLSTKLLTEQIKLLEKQSKNTKDLAGVTAKIGICYHMIALETGKNADTSIKKLQKSLSLHNDPLVKAFLGSAMTLKGNEKQDLGILGQGLLLIDEARNESPDNISILLLRVSNGAGMPDFILEYNKRLGLLNADIQHSEKMYAEGTLPVEMFVEFKYLKSKLVLKEKKLNEATQIWNEIITGFPDSKFARLSAQELSKYSE
ncbi:MAG: hypothetical protein A2015_08280 [Spirochaetes bacterium GWF1_31_7]|nr:MAG: hypothetical protein A2Y30_08475 [Spirochaetes bacterium GWE1_32_154]OHD47145.1 MAG: hypothetical protein A2015_08280 [Spirochaetes bacterium GWF1_31_7]OHD47454.1 MAG: hypothetical protein A2Y29_08700 [Spirochaetes bacterium GWE2_31_10]OHD81813.1 MAG: hypothetical protein A2355_02515 [Spirochaetes bacterium RIFOXYB1_FULL_32_8]HBD94939.1 hypothetical protein [Spirochaetia bacterium]